MAPVLLLIGFTSVIAQIVFMRELMVVFSGNELSLGLTLACWLFWTAAGSAVVGRFSASVAMLDVLIAVALPGTLFAIRSSGNYFRTVPGEMLGPGAMLVACFVTLSVFCFLSGGLFAAGSRGYGLEKSLSTAHATGSVYLLEAVGAGAGGALASLVLIRHLNATQIVLLLAFSNVFAAVSLSMGPRWYRRLDVVGWLTVLGVVMLPLLALRIETASLQRLWTGFHVLATQNSVYGNLAVIQTEEVRSLYENGLVSFHVPDAAAAEEAVHLALLEHPSPRDVLLIGGGLNGSIAQALRHRSIERIDYVELDPAVFEVAKTWFQREWEALRGDPRVHIHSADGRIFVRSRTAQYDVIILNLPEPQTAQLNRFYTLEFYREASRALNPAGLLAFRLPASENYISPEQAAFFQCVAKTLGAVFPEILAIPGANVHFLGAKRAGSLARDHGVLMARMAERRLDTRYISPHFLPFRMAPDRMQELAAAVRPGTETPVNMDYKPAAYYFDIVLWAARFHHGYRRAFLLASSLDFRLVAAVAAALGLVALFARRATQVAGASVAATGFTILGLELVLLLNFQAVHGYVYQQLAWLTAAFMSGMAAGSYLGLRWSRGRELGWVQLGCAAAPYVLLASLSARAVFLFPLMALVCGAIGGYQFVAASRYSGARNPGLLYALDLAGALAGALLLSIYIIPMFGFRDACVLVAVVNLGPATAAIVFWRRVRQIPAR